MAAVVSRVPHAPVGGDEDPAVAVRLELEAEDAVVLRVAPLAVGGGAAELLQPGAAGADDELAEAAGAVHVAGRRLRGEALVRVVVAGEHQLGAGGVEGVPEGARLRRAVRARGEERVVA